MADHVPVFTGVVERGKVQWDSPASVSSWVATLENKPVEITIRKRRAKRSDQANRYYWSVVVALVAEYCGYEPEEAHDALKLMFLTDHTADGPLPLVKSTAKLTQSEFSDYIERVKRWAATDLGVVIPEANEIAA